MGKIRVKTIGIEDDEKDQKKKAKQKAEAKRIEAAKKLANVPAKEEAEKSTDVSAESDIAKSEENAESQSEKKVKKVKKSKFSTSKKNKHSASYLAIAGQIDKNKKYTISEALDILPKVKRAKFDETVELHINTHEKGISGNVTLKHGTGKKTRIEVADQTEDAKHVEKLIEKIKAGQIEFDILIATPDTMPKLAVVARFLGPRGLMPNPKNGTIHSKPKEAMKKFEGGQINFKTEAKAPIIHLSIGKLSFGDEKLAENIKGTIQAVKSKNIKSVTLKSTMSPGIKIAV